MVHSTRRRNKIADALGTLTENQYHAILNLTRVLGKPISQVEEVCKERFGVEVVELTKAQAHIVIKELAEIYNRWRKESL